MGWFDFFSSNKNEKTYEVFKDKDLRIEDVVVGDVVKLWTPKGKNLICFYNKELGPNVILMRKIENKKLSQRINENKLHVACVSRLRGNMIFINVKFFEDLTEYKKQIESNNSEESIKRFDRIKKREDDARKVAEEKKASLQLEYDKVLLKHQNNLSATLEEFEKIVKESNFSKLGKLKSNLENEIKKIESILEKRETLYDERSEKWQDSEKGELYEDITHELSNLLIDFEGILKKNKQFINK